MFPGLFSKRQRAPSASPIPSSAEEEEFVNVVAKDAESSSFVVVDKPHTKPDHVSSMPSHPLFSALTQFPSQPPEPSYITPIYTKTLLKMNPHLRAVPAMHTTIRTGVLALHDMAIILSKCSENIPDQRSLAMKHISSIQLAHQRALALVIGLILNLDHTWPTWDRSVVAAQEFEFSAAVWLLRLGPCGVTWKFEQHEEMKVVLDVLLAEEEMWVAQNEDEEGWEGKKAEMETWVKELWEWAEGVQGGDEREGREEGSKGKKVAKGSAVRKVA